MKKLFLLYVLTMLSASVFSQSPYTREDFVRDSIRIDSLGLLWDINGSNAVFRKLSGKKKEPDAVFCFDKRFSYTSQTARGTVRGCFYVSTTDGFIAMPSSRRGEYCGLTVNDAEDGLLIITRYGETFHYTTDRHGKRWYNNQPPNITAAEMDAAPGAALTRVRPLTGRFETFTLQNLPAMLYRNRSAATRRVMTYHLFGNGFPEHLNLRNYLGALGVGYYEDSDGNTYICLSLQAGSTSVRVDGIEDVQECFDGTGYKSLTDHVRDLNNEVYSRNEKELQYKEEAITKSDAGSSCVAARRNLLDQEKLMLEKEKKANAKPGSGTGDRDMQKAMAAALDPTDRVVKQRLEAELRICNIEYSITVAQKQGGRKEALQNIQSAFTACKAALKN